MAIHLVFEHLHKYHPNTYVIYVHIHHPSIHATWLVSCLDLIGERDHKFLKYNTCIISIF